MARLRENEQHTSCAGLSTLSVSERGERTKSGEPCASPAIQTQTKTRALERALWLRPGHLLVPNDQLWLAKVGRDDGLVNLVECQVGRRVRGTTTAPGRHGQRFVFTA